MANPPKDSYRILELNPDASLETVKRSYRNLVKLWHPDRYTPGSSMQGIAQEKIKEINLAYADLCKRLAKESAATSKAAATAGPVRNAYAAGAATREPPPPRRPSRPVETAPPPRRPRATGRPETADQEKARTKSPRRPEVREPEPDSSRSARKAEAKKVAPTAKKMIRSIRPILAAVVGLGIAAAIVIFIVNRWPHSEMPSASTSNPLVPVDVASQRKAASPVAAPQDEAKTEATRLARPSAVARTIPHPSRDALWPEFTARIVPVESFEPLVTASGPDTPTYGTTVFDELPCAAHGMGPKSRPFWLRSLETAASELDAFSVGTTRADVIKLQGRPDRETPSLLCYGASTVILSGGKVVGWHRGDTPLKAREAREVAYDIAVTFTLGSTKAEVIAAQGPPQHASENVYQYGSSTVEFQGGRVARWREGVPALRVHVMAEAAYGRTDVFTVGSTRAQVIAIQGSPDSESDSLLLYGTAKVLLRDGRVTSWQDRVGRLRARAVSPGIAPGGA